MSAAHYVACPECPVGVVLLRRGAIVGDCWACEIDALWEWALGGMATA